MADLSERAGVVMERGLSYAKYTITGKLGDVFDAIELIFSEYDPRGYSTKVDSIEMGMDGKYTAQMWRALSCE